MGSTEYSDCSTAGMSCREWQPVGTPGTSCNCSCSRRSTSCRHSSRIVRSSSSRHDRTSSSSSSSMRSSRHRWRKHCGFLHLLLALCSFQAFVSTAAAAPRPPCVACDDCITSSCLRVCVPSCRTAPTIAEGSDLSVEQCKHKGQEAALKIAKAACKLSQTSCSVSTKAPATFASVSAVAASQCAALANAGCQKMATSATYSPCGANQYFGHRVCSGRQFADIYRVKVGELCLGAMHKLG